MAANLAEPCSVQKYGAKMQSEAHFLLRNLQAPQGEPVPFPVPDSMAETHRERIQNFRHTSSLGNGAKMRDLWRMGWLGKWGLGYWGLIFKGRKRWVGVSFEGV